MTNEEIKELDRKIAVMEASKTKEIEVRPRRGFDAASWLWTIPPVLGWNWYDFDYRVKPKLPIRIHITNGNIVWISTQNPNLSLAGDFIELTDEVKAKLGL